MCVFMDACTIRLRNGLPARVKREKREGYGVDIDRITQTINRFLEPGRSLPVQRMKQVPRPHVLLAAVLLLASLPAPAQDYPSRVVRIIVPQAPGAGPDLVARYLAQKLTES